MQNVYEHLYLCLLYTSVIAADVAVMNYARQIGQEVHLSTQLNISNAEALKFLSLIHI